jgi:hypothetical protein
MFSNWRSWLVVGIVLLSAHGATAWYYAARYENGRVFSGPNVLKLDMTPEEWAQALGGMDSAAYLRVAENFAAGNGVTSKSTDPASPHDEPFYYWGPGAPVAFGIWLKLVGRETMWPFFGFAVVAQLLFGMLSIATASIWTRNTWALATVAICTGFCPPLQQLFYGPCLTSSEIVALVPLSAIVFALSKAFAAYHRTEGTFWGNALHWRVWLWFALAGFFIGLNSLVRDSAEVLATFVVVFMVGRAVLFDRRRLALAACAALILFESVNVVRYPVKHWNKHRIGVRVVSTGVSWGVWYNDIWSRHDKFAWYVPCGIGCGEYLNPAAAQRVEAYFAEKKPHPELYSLGQLAQAAWKRPLDAVAFKVVRLPVLWLGTTDMWPRLHWGLVPIWCIAFYGSFALFCGVQFRRGRRIPEELYIYLLMMVCASAMIHYEFRYTYPIWNSLVMVPGLLVATLSRSGWLAQSRDRGPDDSVRPTLLVPRSASLAA